MSQQLSIETILDRLTKIRKEPINKYPQEIWNDINKLSKIYSLERISKDLKIDLRYLKKKMMAKKDKISAKINFIEVPIKNVLPENIIIELKSKDLIAKIQGPLSCINCICELFGRKS